MSKSKRKQVKSKFHPTPQKSVHIAEDVDSYRRQNFKWRVIEKYIDYDDEEWGWKQVDIRRFFQKLLPRLHDYETMTWDEIFRRQSCHSWEIGEIPIKAQRKLREKYPENETFHQIDMEQPCRLLGIRDRQILYLIWYDPHHTVCPV